MDEHPVGLRATIPVSLGFFDFAAQDVLHTGLPEHVGTASIVPGLRLDVRATDRWLLSPFLEAGAAKDFEGGDVVAVGGIGVESEAIVLDADAFTGLLRNRLVAAGSRTTDSDERESYFELRTSLEMTWPLDWRLGPHGTDVTTFGAAYVFYEPPEATVTRLLSEPQGDATWVQWEVGVTLGTRPRGRWWKIPFPRLGLSYRFGDGKDAVRVMFGAPF
jgi:hypothetical protein